MKKKHKKKRVWLYILIGVLLLLAIVFAIFLRKEFTQEDSNDSTTVIEEKSENKNKTEYKTENKTETKTKNNTENNAASIQDLYYEALGIKAYEYPSEFSMGDNLKVAIVQLALTYDNFDKTVVKSEEWKDIFIAKFIQNSRLSFDYLNQIVDKNDGQISISELNYIQCSLTNIELDFSSYVKDCVNRNDAASGMNYGFITNYTYELTDEGVCITADLEVGAEGTDSTKKRELTVNLIKNAYSCFDGYSIDSISSRELTSQIEQENEEHIFYGTDMMEEDNGNFPFEFLYSEDDLNYAHFVYVDMTELTGLADFVRKNPGSDFKVTYVLNRGESDTIEKVVPIDITLAE